MSSLGVTPESLAAMSPEDQAKINAKIADIMKKQQELQANASGTAAPTTVATAGSSGAGSSTDSQQPSFLNKALTSLTQSATDAASKLDLA
jgi:pantothenate kinase